MRIERSFVVASRSSQTSCTGSAGCGCNADRSCATTTLSCQSVDGVDLCVDASCPPGVAGCACTAAGSCVSPAAVAYLIFPRIDTISHFLVHATHAQCTAAGYCAISSATGCLACRCRPDSSCSDGLVCVSSLEQKFCAVLPDATMSTTTDAVASGNVLLLSRIVVIVAAFVARL